MCGACLVDLTACAAITFPRASQTLRTSSPRSRPTPPPTDRPGGVLFMAPFDPPLDRWFAYVRWGPHVDRFDGK